MASPHEIHQATQLLCALIAAPTHQTTSSGSVGNERGLCDALVPHLLPLGPDELAIVDAPRASGGPGAYLYVRWGTPTLVINIHIDTVPPNEGWTSDPWTPVVKADRIVGLGACDIKGAIAALCTAARTAPPRDIAFLFSGDEERGTASLQHFLASSRAQGLRFAVVSEPTARSVGIAHRGMLAYRCRLAGQGGHSSLADRLPRPFGTMARFAVQLDDLARAHLDQGPPQMKGLCLNIAGMSPALAFNVVPEKVEMTFSVRPWPGFARDQWDDTLAEIAASVDSALAIDNIVDHEPFATTNLALPMQVLGGHFDTVGPLQFWTEAALFASAGIAACVIGPGNIAQAHAPDEYLLLTDLAWGIDLYKTILGSVRP